MNDKDSENLISHLEALRQTLLKCFISLGVVLPFVFFLAPKALDYLMKILIGKNNISFNYFSPTEVFILEIKIAVLIDLVICFPYIAKKIWDFILPALYDNERKFIKSIVFLSSSLFVFGVLFCLFFILPLIIRFGMSFSTGQIQAVFGISNVVNLSLWLMAVFGLMFQMPLITYSLIKFGIIEYDSIADKRPYVIVILLILAAILTPPDVVSQIMLFIPTYLLFELGLLFSRASRCEIVKSDELLTMKHYDAAVATEAQAKGAKQSLIVQAESASQREGAFDEKAPKLLMGDVGAQGVSSSTTGAKSASQRETNQSDELVNKKDNKGEADV